jgi:hypothetical protein
MQSVLITTKVMSSNLDHGKVYSIQHYVVKFVRDLRQVGGFLRVLRFPQPLLFGNDEISISENSNIFNKVRAYIRQTKRF